MTTNRHIESVSFSSSSCQSAVIRHSRQPGWRAITAATLGMLLGGCLLPGQEGSDSDSIRLPQAAVTFRTRSVALDASDFYIEANGVRFVGAPSITVLSDPGDDTYTTLELDWREHDVEMRMFMYFKSDGRDWWAFEVRTYDGNQDADWITYEGEFFRSPLGQPFRGTVHLDTATHGSPGWPSSVPGVIHFDDIELQAFRTPRVCEDPRSPYLLDVFYPFIVFGDGPDTGFGAVVMLLDSSCMPVIDQREFVYQWTADDPDIVSVQVSNACTSPVQPPCPAARVHLTANEPGDTTVRVTVSQNGQIVARGEMEVTVASAP